MFIAIVLLNLEEKKITKNAEVLHLSFPSVHLHLNLEILALLTVLKHSSMKENCRFIKE